MRMAHDQPSGNVVAASEVQAAAQISVDPLSDVLRTVRLQAAQFFRIEATSPWCVDIPRATDFAGIILPRARHVISYHVVLEGSGLAAVPGTEPVSFQAGDIIVIPHGHPYLMTSAPNVPPELDLEETLQFFRDLAAGRLPFTITEGGGNPPRAEFLCGFLGCDTALFNPLFSALPGILHIRRPGRPPTDLLDRLIALTMAETRAPRPGGESIRLGLSELMFVELLRRHLGSLAEEDPGWLAGLRDPTVGRALALLHTEPARNWTLDSLARAAGLSRTVLADRFARCVGETPMRYLALWRMQLASRLLTDGSAKVSAIAEQVGFRSEAAFSRAFKKRTGLSPSGWRRARSNSPRVG